MSFWGAAPPRQSVRPLRHRYKFDRPVTTLLRPVTALLRPLVMQISLSLSLSLSGYTEGFKGLWLVVGARGSSFSSPILLRDEPFRGDDSIVEDDLLI